MVATAAAIAGIVGTGISAGKALFSGGGTAQNRQYELMLKQLEDSNANRTNAQIQGANINRLATAGYDDGQGGGMYYDPATGTWHSKLGAQQQAVQDAADRASIDRNTLDMQQARQANMRSDRNAIAAQPMIDAARRRMEGFRPIDAEGLTSDLTARAVDANNQAYTPMRQDLLRTITRTGSGGGDLVNNLGQGQAGDLRRAMLEARIQGLSSVDQINNQRRQGLASDLQTATAAGTPNFQYPGITPSTNNKDLLAAMGTRANSAGYTSALGLNAVNAAQGTANTASGNVKVPESFAGIDSLASGFDQLSKGLNSDTAKGLYAKLFGGKSFDPAGGLSTTWGTSGTGLGDQKYNFGGQTFNPGGVF